MIPFVDPDDPNRAFGFAATPGGSDDCGKCYELTFDGGQRNESRPYSTNAALAGKVLTVMSSNIGWDVGSGQFDVMIPGGGVGLFDSFSAQLRATNPSFSASLGARYGGLLSDCEQELAAAHGWDSHRTAAGLTRFRECLSSKCNQVFSAPAHALLNEGCNFLADWMMAANNPTLTYRQVSCPDILIDRYRVGSGGSEPTPTTGTGGGTRYTVTYSINGGTGTAPAARTVNEGRSIALANGSGLTRSGFMFGGWSTNAAGTGTNYNAGDSLTPTADMTLYARWIAAVLTIDTTRVDIGSGTQSGQNITYRVNLTTAGDFTIEFSVAGEHYVGFEVRVNGTMVGQPVIQGGTGGPNTFQTVSLDDVRLNAGENTIVMNLWSQNTTIGHIFIIGETLVPISVKPGSTRTNNTRPNVTLRPANRGFSAILPNNHGFESYSLVDLQGREVRKGKLKAGAAELHFSNIRQGVLFLRLKGKNGTTVLRATTF